VLCDDGLGIPEGARKNNNRSAFAISVIIDQKNNCSYLRALLKIQSPDGTSSHSTKLPKGGSQVAGYKQGKARAKNCDAAYV